MGCRSNFILLDFLYNVNETEKNGGRYLVELTHSVELPKNPPLGDIKIRVESGKCTIDFLGLYL